jgi:hypothetical protein
MVRSLVVAGFLIIRYSLIIELPAEVPVTASITAAAWKGFICMSRCTGEETSNTVAQRRCLESALELRGMLRPVLIWVRCTGEETSNTVVNIACSERIRDVAVLVRVGLTIIGKSTIGGDPDIMGLELRKERSRVRITYKEVVRMYWSRSRARS